MKHTPPIVTEFTARELAVLATLGSASGHWVTFAAIIRAVYDDADDAAYRNSVRTLISRLRGKGVTIDCRRDTGYRLPTAPVCASCGRPL